MSRIARKLPVWSCKEHRSTFAWGTKLPVTKFSLWCSLIKLYSCAFYNVNIIKFILSLVQRGLYLRLIHVLNLFYFLICTWDENMFITSASYHLTVKIIIVVLSFSRPSGFRRFRPSQYVTAFYCISGTRHCFCDNWW